MIPRAYSKHGRSSPHLPISSEVDKALPAHFNRIQPRYPTKMYQVSGRFIRRLSALTIPSSSQSEEQPDLYSRSNSHIIYCTCPLVLQAPRPSRRSVPGLRTTGSLTNANQISCRIRQISRSTRQRVHPDFLLIISSIHALYQVPGVIFEN